MIDIRKGPSWPWALLFLVAALFIYGDRSARTQFAQNSYAGTSTGTANAQVITIPNVGAFSDILNQPVTFIAGGGLNNTGPMTLNATGLGVKNVYRAVPNGGVVALGGGEVIGGQLVGVVYDGTQFQLLTNANPAIPGSVIDYGGPSCPTGYLTANSQAVSAVTYAPLANVLSGTWGVSPGNVVLPDLRNRTTYGQDQDVSGFSNRITVAAGNFDGQSIGAVGAAQNIALNLTQIPAFNPASVINSFNPAATINSFNPAATINPFTPTGTVAGTVTGQGSGVVTVNNVGPATAAVGPVWGVSTLGWTGSISINAVTLSGSSVSLSGSSVTLSGSSIGGSQAHPTLSPGAIINKCVRA